MRVSSKIKMERTKKGYIKITIHKFLIEEIYAIVLPMSTSMPLNNLAEAV